MKNEDYIKVQVEQVVSDEALAWVEKEHSDKSDAEKYRLAQAQTLLNLSDKYASELN